MIDKVNAMLEHPYKGLSALSPEQTVSLLHCFMNDAPASYTADRIGVSVEEAAQCTTDLWNIFSFRKQVNHHA